MIANDTFISVPEAAREDQRSPLAVLRRFARATAVGKPVEQCELCSLRLPAEHRHLVDLRTRRLICCCEPCGVLFSGRQSAVYRRVPQTIRSLADFRISDAQWDRLLIPINLAFFYRRDHPLHSPVTIDTAPGEGLGAQNPPRPLVGEGPGVRAAEKIIAVYPSPAGPIESLLDLDSWQAIAADYPLLDDLQPEVEALLVNRLHGEHLYYLVPIDECYRLNGLIRLYWRGLSGGSEVWEEVENYFNRLKEKSCST